MSDTDTVFHLYLTNLTNNVKNNMPQTASSADHVIIEPTKQHLRVTEAADQFILWLDKICYRDEDCLSLFFFLKKRSV